MSVGPPPVSPVSPCHSFPRDPLPASGRPSVRASAGTPRSRSPAPLPVALRYLFVRDVLSPASRGLGPFLSVLLILVVSAQEAPPPSADE